MIHLVEDAYELGPPQKNNRASARSSTTAATRISLSSTEPTKRKIEASTAASAVSASPAPASFVFRTDASTSCQRRSELVSVSLQAVATNGARAAAKSHEASRYFE